jgi:hypothetical protein
MGAVQDFSPFFFWGFSACAYSRLFVARGGAGPLDACVHLGVFVVKDVVHVVAALQGAGDGLEADVAGAAVAPEGDEVPPLVSGEAAASLEGRKPVAA